MSATQPRARALAALPTSLGPHVSFDLTLEEAWPADVDPGIKPFHNLVLVQYPTPKTKTKSGIILSEETRTVVQANSVIVKVIALGPMAFKNRETGVPWVEGAWCKEGDFVRIGKYDPDKWEVLRGKTQDEGVVLFGLAEDLNLKGLVTTNPLSIVAYV